VFVRAVLIVLAVAIGGCAGGGDRPSEDGAAGSAAGDVPPAAGEQAPPAADAAIPRDPTQLAERLTSTQRGLDQAVDAWREQGDPSRGSPPEDVTLYALYQQRIHRPLSTRPRLAGAVLAQLPGSVAAHARATLRARRKLAPLATPQPRRRFRTGRPQPAGVLLRHYREAQRRFGVGWRVLAAVNFVESAFGRLRNNSTAGAQGPMQFIPSTWAAYGLGGDVQDPRDAILGAANYLHANGAPGDYKNALYRYNPSSLYVDAVLAYAGRIRRDARNFYAYYAWQVFVQTPGGVQRITGPAAP
jgi:membrane-bound lytic murein transglycosylase B